MELGYISYFEPVVLAFLIILAYSSINSVFFILR